MAIARRAFAGGAVQSTLASGITATSTTITVAAATGWPTGAEFFCVIDPGQASEEKILCTRSGTTLTCASTAKRGVDGTAAASHNQGAVIYPCLAAADADEANLTASTLTTQGDLLTMDSSPALTRLAVGAAGTVVTSDGSDPAWGTVGAAGLADDVWAKKLTLNAQTASYTLVLADAGKIVTVDVASANTLTVPPNSSVAFPVGSNLTVVQIGAGATTLTAGVGVTVNSFQSQVVLSGQWAAATLVKVGTDSWVAFGNLS